MPSWCWIGILTRLAYVCMNPEHTYIVCGFFGQMCPDHRIEEEMRRKVRALEEATLREKERKRREKGGNRPRLSFMEVGD